MQHGDEVVSLEVALQTARLLLESYGQDPWLTALVDRREIYIMPLANPLIGFDSVTDAGAEELAREIERWRDVIGRQRVVYTAEYLHSGEWRTRKNPTYPDRIK